MIFGLSRTFDFTDEAWATGLIAKPSLPFGNVFFYQFIIHPIFLFFGESVLAMRILRLALGSFVAVVCAHVTVKSIKGTHRNLEVGSKLGIHLLAQSASLISWFWTPSILGYNELNSSIVQISVMLLFFITNRTYEARAARLELATSNVLILYLAGVSGSLLFYTKIPSYLLFSFAYLIFCILMFRKKSWLSVGAFITLVSTPAVGWLLSPHVKEYLSNFLILILSSRLRTSAGHGDSIIFFYIADFLINMMIVVIPVLVASLVLESIKLNSQVITSRSGLITFLTKPLTVFMTIFAAAAVWIFHPFNTAGQTSGRLVILMLAISSACLLGNWQELRKLFLIRDLPTLFVLLVMMCVPFINSFGTNVILSAHFGLSAISVSCFVAYLALGFSWSHDKSNFKVNKVLTPILVLALIVFLSLGTVKNAIYPYRSEGIFAPKYPVQISGPLAGLWLSREENSFARWLRDENVRLNASEAPAVSLEVPGALVFFNNSSFTSSWIEYPVILGFEGLAKACEGFSGREFYLLLRSSRSVEDKNVQFLNDSLEGCNLRYPDDFVLESSHASLIDIFNLSVYSVKK